MVEKIEFANTGVKVSRMGIGTYYDPWWILSAKVFNRRSGREEKIKAIRTAIDDGINLIDTAEIYGSEELVGEAIKGYEREDLFIASKVWPSHFSEEKVARSCERSLKRLGLKYMDLYQLHFPSRRIPIGETMGAMEKLVDQGKIRYIGISNFDIEKMESAISAMKRHQISSTQMPLNLTNRKNESTILPKVKEHKMAFLAYYPLGHGSLVNEAQFGNQLVSSIREKHGNVSPPQIALNWFYSKFDCVFPIPRASSSNHVHENSLSMGWSLDPSEIAALEQRFMSGKN
jgi:diketogulonate reductase-like aldo/keto reductase